MTQHHPARRVTAVAAGLAATALLAAGCSAGDDTAAEDTIVVSTFPFGVEEFQEAVIDPFTAETGIKVEVETGSNADRLSQLQVAGDSSGIDVMLISDYYAALGQESDLFQQVDAAKVPSLDEVADFALEDAYQGPAYSYQLNGTIYSTEDLSADEAAEWDLYGDEALAGRLALPDISVTAGQLMISGVGETYGDGPYDIDTALETLGGWAPGILQFYSSSTEVTNLLTQARSWPPTPERLRDRPGRLGRALRLDAARHGPLHGDQPRHDPRGRPERRRRAPVHRLPALGRGPDHVRRARRRPARQPHRHRAGLHRGGRGRHRGRPGRRRLRDARPGGARAHPGRVGGPVRP